MSKKSPEYIANRKLRKQLSKQVEYMIADIEIFDHNCLNYLVQLKDSINTFKSLADIMDEKLDCAIRAINLIKENDIAVRNNLLKMLEP